MPKNRKIESGRSGLAARVGKVRAKPSRGPLWRGPEQDGITFSLLTRFLTCRERFRCLVVEGLRPREAFNHRIEYGSMWHVCEEEHARRTAAGRSPDATIDLDWMLALKKYVEGLIKKYPFDQEKIVLWYEICRVQFPLYIEHWAKHPDVVGRTPLLQEAKFDVPYKLPSGRTVRLRGKWDSVDLIGRGKSAGVYLQENKTKSRIDEVQMQRQLSFDLQTMLYLVALQKCNPHPDSSEANSFWGMANKLAMAGTNRIAGVRYNVVRRTEHRVGKKETVVDFCERLAGIIREEPEQWFMRWRVEIGPADVTRFRRECLDPILEQLCDWWEHITWAKDDPFKSDTGLHYRHPFGSVNWLDEAGFSDLDEYLASGSEVGLTRVDNLFPELT